VEVEEEEEVRWAPHEEARGPPFSWGTVRGWRLGLGKLFLPMVARSSAGNTLDSIPFSIMT
jgi:hypothetical protein